MALHSGHGKPFESFRREVIRLCLHFRKVTVGAVWALDGVGPERHPRDQRVQAGNDGLNDDDVSGGGNHV